MLDAFRCAGLAFFLLFPAGPTDSGPLLLDDFTGDPGTSSWGTEWRMFTDRVMGGGSTASYKFVVEEGIRCIWLTGDVSLENNGGFVQVALPLKKKGKSLDASAYRGIRIKIKGNGETYHVHIRNNRTILPWQFYKAPFVATAVWRTIDIPFSAFSPYKLRKKFSPEKLKRVAIVAIGKEFHADIKVAHIELYR